MEIENMFNSKDVQELIDRDALIKHEEGGYFKVTYVSPDIIAVSPRYEGGERASSTKINYLLAHDDFSGWHRIKSNETWRFKEGESLTLLIIGKDGKMTSIKIGDPEKEADALLEYTVEKEQWFAAFINNQQTYSYVECEVTPGFDYRDWQLGKKEYLIKQYPQHTTQILKYSRDEAIKRDDFGAEKESVSFVR